MRYRILCFGLMIVGAVLSTVVFASSTKMSSQIDHDVRCLTLIRIMHSFTSTSDKDFLSHDARAVAAYYLGRIDAESPDLDLGGATRSALDSLDTKKKARADFKLCMKASIKSASRVVNSTLPYEAED